MCTVWPRIAPHCTALYRTALHCTALHCTAAHCTALHCACKHWPTPIHQGSHCAGTSAGMLAQVRHQKLAIDLPLIQEAIDKRQLGLATGRLPDSEAKRRLALVEAGRAVALALTPGIPPLEHLSIAPRGPILSRLSFAHVVCLRPASSPLCWLGQLASC